MKILATIALTALSGPVLAGGDAFLVHKVDFRASGSWGTFVAKLQIADKSQNLLGCSEFTINGRYSWWRWWIRNRSTTAPKWRDHQVAIQAIRSAASPFVLATIGQALKVTDKRCVFESEGVSPILASDGRFVGVTTFYLTS